MCINYQLGGFAVFLFFFPRNSWFLPPSNDYLLYHASSGPVAFSQATFFVLSCLQGSRVCWVCPCSETESSLLGNHLKSLNIEHMFQSSLSFPIVKPGTGSLAKHFALIWGESSGRWSCTSPNLHLAHSGPQSSGVCQVYSVLCDRWDRRQSFWLLPENVGTLDTQPNFFSSQVEGGIQDF